MFRRSGIQGNVQPQPGRQGLSLPDKLVLFSTDTVALFFKRGNEFDRLIRLQNYQSVKQFTLRNSEPGGETTLFNCRGTALQPRQRGAKLVHPELCICQLPVALCGKALPAWI